MDKKSKLSGHNEISIEMSKYGVCMAKSGEIGFFKRKFQIEYKILPIKIKEE